MTIKNTNFNITIASIEDVPEAEVNNPFLTRIKFIFADNQGNGNKQGITEDEFDAIAQSALHMPIKMKFSEEDVEGHAASTPIGHITGMTRAVEEGVPQLLGEALLYRNEYPEEVQFLKTKHAEGEAPGISWEIAYKDSIVDQGIEWLKGTVAMAATFVKKPAYGKRTRLLAIAEENVNNDEFMTQLKEITDAWASTNEPKGGNKVEEELAKAQAALEEAKAKVTELEGKLTEATVKVDALTEENKGYAQAKVLAERIAKIAEAGIKFELEGEALTAKQSFWLSLSEEAFDGYIADLAAAKASVKVEPTKTTVASKREDLPKFTAVAGQELTLEDLKASARRASRGELADL